MCELIDKKMSERDPDIGIACSFPTFSIPRTLQSCRQDEVDIGDLPRKHRRVSQSMNPSAHQTGMPATPKPKKCQKA